MDDVAVIKSRWDLGPHTTDLSNICICCTLEAGGRGHSWMTSDHRRDAGSPGADSWGLCTVGEPLSHLSSLYFFYFIVLLWTAN